MLRYICKEKNALRGVSGQIESDRVDQQYQMTPKIDRELKKIQKRFLTTIRISLFDNDRGYVIRTKLPTEDNQRSQ